MSNPLSKEAESNILSAIQNICDSVSGHLSAESLKTAAVKAARDHGFGPDMIKLMCAGYNTGATTYQRETGGNILQKHASFPLADAEAIIREVYPETSPAKVAELAQSTVVSPEYSSPPKNLAKRAAEQPLMMKVAEEKIPLTYEREKKAADPVKILGESRRLQHEIKEARHAVLYAEEQLIGTVSKMASYFKRSSLDRKWNYGEVNYTAAKRFGKVGELVMKAVAQHNGYLVETSAMPKKAIDWKSSPFVELAECVKLAREVDDLKDKHIKVAVANREKIATLTAPYRVPEPPAVKERSILKQAAIAPAAVNFAVVSGALKNLTGDYLKPTPTSELVRSKMDDLSDPEHEEELRRIRAQSMLQNLLTEDEVISGHNPDQVMKAYNELSSLAPRAAQQPAVARSVLRQWMAQGDLGSYDAKGMTDLENNLTRTQGTPAARPPAAGEKTSNVLTRRTSVLSR